VGRKDQKRDEDVKVTRIVDVCYRGEGTGKRSGGARDGGTNAGGDQRWQAAVSINGSIS
jgi:hypothetical protein